MSVVLFYVLLGYFFTLFLISYFTGKKADNQSFFVGNRQSKWWLVAFGMIGASLSGVTFISIPGLVQGSGFTYMQIVIGYILGYAVISFVLLPTYYKYNLTSIYEYLGQRFGPATYKLGAFYFLLSRLIGASLRLYLVASVLYEFVLKDFGISFEITVIFSVLLIWVYTFRGGIKTIVWTDSLQTLFMLISVALSVYFISDALHIQGTIFDAIDQNGMGKWIDNSSINSKSYWIKGVLGGIFITLGMTGVDQDMMQKNLSVSTLKKSQLNMMSMSFILFFVNILFLVLGALLYLYIDSNPTLYELWQSHGGKSDHLFPTIAIDGPFTQWVSVTFFLGLIAAAYSSADSALTSLSTSLSVDFLNIKSKDERKQTKIRKGAHIFMSVLLVIAILIFNSLENDQVINKLFDAANYTYGPLLGIFLFGITNKLKVNDVLILIISIVVPIIVYVLKNFVIEEFTDYRFGYELLGIHALIIYLLMLLASTISKD